MKLKIYQIFQFLFLIITFESIGGFTSIVLGNDTFWWIVNIVLLLTIFYLKPLYFNLDDNKLIWPIKLLLFWNIICIIRGFFVAENYWEWKHLIISGMVLLIPYTIYIFTNKQFVQMLIAFWLKYALFAFFLFIPFVIYYDFYGHYLVPILLLSIMVSALPFRWKIITLFFLILILTAGFESRSNILRYSFAILLGLLFYFRLFITIKMIKFVHIFLILSPIILLYLGITDTFNVFKINEYVSVSKDVEDNQLDVDTRTFLYVEVLSSAYKNDYYMIGRTPARGYDSVYFGDYLAKELGTGKAERFSSEVSIQNIFTWNGIVGVVLYFLVFFMASFQAIYRSNSFFMKMIGLFVAFRWSFAFLEDFTSFSIQYMFLWLLIAMCYSTEFRKMNNIEFTYWIRGIFKKKHQTSDSKIVNHNQLAKGM